MPGRTHLTTGIDNPGAQQRMPPMDRRTSRGQVRGFTLIELVIAVAVVAILTAVALPSYRAYIIRGNIPEATSNLASKQVQMEQFFQDNRTYVGGPACASDTTTSRVFDFSCTDGTDVVAATTFTLTAVGKGTMAGFSFSVTQTGAKSTRAVPAGSGWSQPSPNNCWVTKKGGLC